MEATLEALTTKVDELSASLALLKHQTKTQHREAITLFENLQTLHDDEAELAAKGTSTFMIS
jgi:hypothetical protein